MGQRVVTNADESLEMPGPGGDATGQIFSHPYGKAEDLVHNLSHQQWRRHFSKPNACSGL